MDYVLFGMGYGATLMLLGWALRTFGPERKYKHVNPEDIDRTVEQRRWIRFIQGLGGVFAIAGTSMVLFTFVIMLMNPDDDTGRFIALVIWGFLTVAILIWCWFYVSSYGLLGIWSRKDGYGLRGVSSKASPLHPESASTTRVVSASTAPYADSEPDGTTASTDAEGIEPDVPAIDAGEEPQSQDGDDPPERIGPSLDEVRAETDEVVTSDPDPEYDFGDGTDTTVPSEIGGRSEAIRLLRERQARSGNSPA